MDLIREAVGRSGLPVHVLLRPRGGDFVYTDAEFDVMCEDLKHLHRLGASGAVLGVLRSDGSVDVERTRALVEMAGSLEVTFNRAFDHVASLDEALEDVIATGCRRVLTSGGARDVVSGGKSLARLIEQAAGRIDIAVGGGLRLKNAAAVARTTGAQHFHGSIRRIVAGPHASRRSRCAERCGDFAAVAVYRRERRRAHDDRESDQRISGDYLRSGRTVQMAGSSSPRTQAQMP